jgi:hypothetical protein
VVVLVHRPSRVSPIQSYPVSRLVTLRHARDRKEGAARHDATDLSTCSHSDRTTTYISCTLLVTMSSQGQGQDELVPPTDDPQEENPSSSCNHEISAALMPFVLTANAAQRDRIRALEIENTRLREKSTTVSSWSSSGSAMQTIMSLLD